MRKMMVFALCAAMTMSAAACSSNTKKTEAKSETKAATTEAVEESTMIGMPNPFVSFDTLKEAADFAGLDFTAPEILDGYEVDEINAIEGDLVQIIFKNSDGDEVRFRKGAGTDDISGDYTEYSEEKTAEVNGNTVTLKGDDGKYKLAVWNDGENSFAVYTPGSTEEEITAFVGQIK